MNHTGCKVLVLGGGPGGYVCAIRAGQLGLDTVLVERGALGGTCLNEGCIPSKALLHAADEYHRANRSDRDMFGISVSGATIDFGRTMAWKDSIVTKLNGGVDGLLRQAKVRVVKGAGNIVDGKTVVVATDEGEQLFTTEHLVLATGSESIELPSLPFGGAVLSSTDLLRIDHVPARLAIVGGGYIGLELGTAFSKLGAEVAIIEATSALLPGHDPELVRPVAMRLAELGIVTQANARVVKFDAGQKKLHADVAGKALVVNADAVLVTIGRRPRLTGYGLEKLDLAMAGRALAIDARCQTSMHNVWAVGDLTAGPMLAHRAMAQGEMVAEIIAGKRRIFDHNAIPAVCYTDPEIVTVGLSPAEAEGRGIATKSGKFSLAASGRAMTMGAARGFVRVMARSDNNVVIGAQAVGTGVAELAAVFTLAMQMEAQLDDVVSTIHAHPTLGEAFQEASYRALGRGLH